MGVPAAGAIWAAVVLLAGFYGVWLGFGGPRFAIALTVAAALFAFELFLAAPRVLDSAQRSFGGRSAFVAPLVPLFTVLVYSFGVSRDWKWMLAGAAYAIIPALILANSKGKAPGTWEDYVTVALLVLPAWLPPPYRLLYHVFPYPSPLTHALTILMALSTGVAAFVLLRRLDGVGYAIDWRRGFGWNVGFHFVIFAAIAVPIGLTMRFLDFNPMLPRIHSLGISGVAVLPISTLGVLLFTAWPEEFLFRGILQNLLSRTLKNDWAGLIAASVIFGFSHIFHAPFPNWKYVVLATIAGLLYGRAWMRTRSLVPGTLVHALVDISWHLLFR
jgi:uncharacterized protein